MQEYIRKLISQTIALIEKNKSHGNEFNLLKISGMGSSEVFTHTPILKELLDPRGSHGQGNLFLKSFIDSFCSEFIVDEFVQIKKEQRVGDKKKSYGQIDLIISNKTQILIIENKIYAEDQVKQLNRYYEYCESTKKQQFMIYLTLDGKEPSQFSLGNIKNVDGKYFLNDGENQQNIYLKCLSYQTDIIFWLKNIQSAIGKASNLVAAIQQYINLLKMLTGELITGKKEKKKMLIDVQLNELEAIKKISDEYSSSEYRGKLLYNLFEYIKNVFVQTGEFLDSNTDDFLNIQYNIRNCQKWFDQLSSKNLSQNRDVIGCVLQSKINPNITFLFVAATDYFHYGIVLKENKNLSLDQIQQLFPTWAVRDTWKKIPNSWISHSIGNLRGFSGDAFKLLTIRNNIFLDDFINDRLKELDLIIKK